MMVSLFLLFCIVVFIVEIILINKFKKTKDVKYWYPFVGISISAFIYALIAYLIILYGGTGDLGNGILCLIACAIANATSIIMLVVGAIIKKKNNIKTKINKKSILYGVICILITIIILFVTPKLTHYKEKVEGQKVVVNYLNNKYGNGNYKVVKTYASYIHDEFSVSFNGFYYEIKSDFMDNTFIVEKNSMCDGVSNDTFLPVYYSQKYNLNYSFSYSNFNNSFSYNFDELDNYMNKIAKERNLLSANKKINLSYLYSSYIYSCGGYIGQPPETKYNSNYYIVPNNQEKIPEFEKVVEDLANFKMTYNY